MPEETALDAILFYASEPVLKRDLARILEVSPEEVSLLIEDAKIRFEEMSGLRVLETDTHVTLVTAPIHSDHIKKMRTEELSRDIGKAGAETLAIVLYQGPVSRSDIDHIRGVNSTFILRNLTVRGLVMRVQNPKDQRSFRYSATPELLAHLGVTHVSELPEYGKIVGELENVAKESRAQEEQREEGAFHS